MLLSLLGAPWLAPGPSSARLASPAAMQLQGGSLRTWHSPDPWAEEGDFFLGTEGRPMDANVELWSGPDNTAFRMRVYGENGNLRPVRGTVGMRGRHPRSNAIAVRNAGPLEFPMSDVGVFGGGAEQPSIECLESASTVQGGSLRTYPVGPYVDAVQVLLRSDGLPVNATIEIVQGPNTNRQGIELYTDDGRERPIFYILETPGYGSVVEVRNTGPLEFPIAASVVPHSVGMADESFGGGGYGRGGYGGGGGGGYGGGGGGGGGGRYGGGLGGMRPMGGMGGGMTMGGMMGMGQMGGGMGGMPPPRNRAEARMQARAFGMGGGEGRGGAGFGPGGRGGPRGNWQGGGIPFRPPPPY
ncbi:hypothetical protein EMIHUDRAFT_453372 [Emiliania huxleyi CCMP1516]|uniref:Uncharacterized protein n=2 Tax=Emiliania huxleyi TaxID=2903 RepID=A0A0D3I6S1_EMIH1|nr:hypothetical protein EMIHUDRAFT_453372 [Emiliania huxleyi CCMP1516]EOD06956.1 hypothetical protein EMIHUDRAFT_453372 [Emiliania huxleyi CCMP1516]|eukprot:XP_005759385.1 hypothetical protein EMIHUDRAFT_453372 [Emiliania huxleyi CCMP1516]